MTKAMCMVTLPLALALVALPGSPPAFAHALHLVAEGDGTVIRGRAYYQGGSPAVGAQVLAFSPEGRKLGETRTDADGAFTLPASYRCDHRLLVVTGDGHGAEFRLPAAELSASLPPPGGEAAPPGETAAAADELTAIRSQLASLREQLAGYEQRTRLRDVIGGIGYIVGVAGVAFYIAARRAERAVKQKGR